MERLSTDHTKFLRARYRVSQLKSYYVHLLVYLVTNLFISGVKVAFSLRAGDTWTEAVFNFNTFSVWIIWGIFFLIHTLRVIVLPILMGYDWESRKLESYVDQELKKQQNITF